MALLGETPAYELTQQRFDRMTLSSGAGPVVDARGLPAGPRWPAAVQTVSLLRFRHRFHPWLHRRYGDVYTVRLLPRAQPVVFFTRPEQIREIFAGDPDVLLAGKGNAILGPVMGEHSLLLQDGAAHQRARRLLMPAFNGHALRDYRGLVADLARDEVAHWPTDGQTIRSHDRMNVLTLEVILRVVFGVTDEARLAALRPRVNETVNVSPAVMLVWGQPALRRIGPWRAAAQNQVELDELIFAEIRERRGAADLATRSDVLSRLLLAGGADDAMSDVELRDQLVTLLLAGHETTATALAWALFELGRHPALRHRAQRAADEGDDDFLEAVVKESLRLHPVIPMVARTLTRPMRVAGVDVPAGATVAPSILVAHHRPDNHERPDEFDPDRFLGANPPAATWIPFGGGVRRCIGAGFSLMEGVEVLRAVFAAYSVSAVGEDQHKVRNITSIPARGARIRVRARAR